MSETNNIIPLDKVKLNLVKNNRDTEFEVLIFDHFGAFASYANVEDKGEPTEGLFGPQYRCMCYYNEHDDIISGVVEFDIQYLADIYLYDDALFVEYLQQVFGTAAFVLLDFYHEEFIQSVLKETTVFDRREVLFEIWGAISNVIKPLCISQREELKKLYK